AYACLSCLFHSFGVLESWYVRLVTMMRISAFSEYLLSIRFFASTSSSSRLLGGLVTRMSSIGSTMPRPKKCAQYRFATARAKNPFFARAVANRYWAHFFGRGIVDPMDDMRVTNPPSNPELLDALAKNLVDNTYSLKALTRTIVT